MSHPVDAGATDAAPEVALRPVTDADLPIFFEQQLDPEANYMAAFTAGDPSGRADFDAHWARIRADPTITPRTILAAGQVAGHIASFTRDGDAEVTYWLGKPFWGRGIATTALAAFLPLIPTRPLYARVAKDNPGSLRVLQKCGFHITGVDKGYAEARGAVTEEYILTLAADVPPET
jgi:RimJ/RimL family protein N-acetyltransferase